MKNMLFTIVMGLLGLISSVSATMPEEKGESVESSRQASDSRGPGGVEIEEKVDREEEERALILSEASPGMIADALGSKVKRSRKERRKRRKKMKRIRAGKVYKEDVTTVSDSGNYLIHQKAYYGNVEELRQILESGLCSVDIRNTKYGDTALHLSCMKWEERNIACTRMLLEYGADPTLKDCRGRTPLHVMAGSFSMFSNLPYLHLFTDAIKEIITEYKLDPDIKGAEGDSPLHHAIKSFKKIEKTPRKRGAVSLLEADPELKGFRGIFKAFLDAGANPNSKNDEGLTVLDFASQLKETDLVQSHDLALYIDDIIEEMKKREVYPSAEFCALL